MPQLPCLRGIDICNCAEVTINFKKSQASNASLTSKEKASQCANEKPSASWNVFVNLLRLTPRLLQQLGKAEALFRADLDGGLREFGAQLGGALERPHRLAVALQVIVDKP